MNFGFNDTQQEIQSTARSFLADRFKPEKVRELAESRSYDDSLWKEICELGWAGIAVDEEHGGQGLGIVELVILAEQMGYVAAPTPFLSNAAAGLTISAGGDEQQQEELLPGVASGERRGTVGAAPDDDGPMELVPDADSAAFVVRFGPGGTTVVSCEDAAVEPVELIDATRSFARVGGGSGVELGSEAIDARDSIAVAAAAELVGIAQRALDMSVSYAKEREQFGRPIGAYQAVSHACAEMLWDVEEARSLTYYAAWMADAEPEALPAAASMAKARASDAAWSVTKSAIQVHGGIGFTWEHDLHFLLKRARATGLLFGSADRHRERVASLSGLDG